MSSPDKAQWLDDYAASEVSECVYPFRPDGASTVSQSGRYEGLNSDKLGEQIPEPPEDQYLCDDTSPRLFIEKYFGPDPCKGWENIAQRTIQNMEDNCKEVQCVEVDSNTKSTSSNKHSSPRKGYQESNFNDIDHNNAEPKQTSNLAVEQSSSSSDTDSPDSSNLPRSRSSEAVMINVPVLKGSEVTKENGDKSSEPEKELSINKIDLEENPSADKVKVLTKEHSFTIEVKLKMSGEDNGKISAEELKMSGEDSTKICAESEVAKSVPEKQSEDSSVSS